MFFNKDPPDTKVYADRGTPYPCTQEEIDVLQDQRKKYVQPRYYIDRFEATSLLQQAHDGPLLDAQKEAVKRLNDLQTAQRWGPDIIFKIFNDLDLLLFRRILKGNVYLRWNDTDRTLNGPSSATLAWTCPRGDKAPRCTIEMSTYHATQDTVGLRDVLSTLVHEMVHAYLQILTNRDRGLSDLFTQGHGHSFTKCGQAVMKRLGGRKGGFKDIVACPDLDGRRTGDPRWRSGFRFDGREEERPRGGRWSWLGR